MKLSKRITEMQLSSIRKLVPIADAAKKKGKKVYHLNIGQPDIETPKSFLNAIKAYDEPVIKYSASQGETALIEAIINYYSKYDIPFEKDEVLITNGGSEALLFAVITVADFGDEILVPEPFYSNYNSFTIPVGVKLLPIPTVAENGFRLPSVETMASCVTPNTKAIMLSNPGNPTGVVYTKEELEAVAELAIKHDLFIISDEVYREFVYDGLSYTSFGTIENVKDRVIIVDSISKRYSACGARIGSLASKNKEFIKGALKMCTGRLCVPTLEQVGAVALYQEDESYFEKVNAEYQARRNIVFEALKEMPGVICELPRGAFYVIVKLPVDDSEKFVTWLLDTFDVDGETVMFAPAAGFYVTPGKGTDEVRLAYILNKDDLTKSMNILKVALTQYPGRTNA